VASGGALEGVGDASKTDGVALDEAPLVTDAVDVGDGGATQASSVRYPAVPAWLEMGAPPAYETTDASAAPP